MRPRDDAPYQRSCRAEIPEDEYNRLDREHMDRLAALRERYEREAVELFARYRREHEDEHESFYGWRQADEGELAAAASDVIGRSISDTTWLGFVAAMAQSMERHANLRPDGFVYILEAGPYHKIGRTIHLPSRIKTLNIQLPFPARCVAAFPCGDTARAEAELHRLFSKYRANGEWFTIPDREPWLIGLAWLKNIRYATTEHCPHMGKITMDFHDEMSLAAQNEPHWQAALTAAFNAVEAE